MVWRCFLNANVNSQMKKNEVHFTTGTTEGVITLEEEVENMASSNLAPLPLQYEEMIFRIQKGDKIHSFLKGIGLRPLAKREAAQTLTRVMERNKEVKASKEILMHVVYQKAKDSIPCQIEIWLFELFMVTGLCILLPFWEHLK